MQDDALNKAKREQLELQKAITELEKANMSAEERNAHDEADAAIAVAKDKHRQAKQAGNMKMFVEWVNDTYVPAAKKKAVPEQQEGQKG